MKSIFRNKGGIMGLLRPVGLACLAALAVVTASAADVTLKVELRNGTTEEFKLADKPVVTFSGESCVISCNAANVTYDMGNVARAYFTDGTSAVDEALSDAFSVDFTNPSEAVVRGIAPGASVALYGLDGTMVLEMQADSDGVARIPLDGLASRTVYVVSINNGKNFKLYKK